MAEGHTWLGRCNAGLLFYGWSNDEQADADEGWQAALRAAHLAPADPYSHYAVGMMSIVTNQPSRAMEAAQRSLDLSPSFALGYLELGLARLFAGLGAQAVEPLERGLQLSPHDPQAFIWMQFLAFAHFLSGKFDEAVARARDAAASRPQLFSAHCILACSLVRLGEQEDAQRAVLAMQQSLSASGSDLKQFLHRFTDAGDRKQISAALGEAGWMENSNLQ